MVSYEFDILLKDTDKPLQTQLFSLTFDMIAWCKLIFINETIKSLLRFNLARNGLSFQNNFHMIFIVFHNGISVEKQSGKFLLSTYHQY